MENKKCITCKCNHCQHFDICRRRSSLCFVCMQLGDEAKMKDGQVTCGRYKKVHRL